MNKSPNLSSLPFDKENGEILSYIRLVIASDHAGFDTKELLKDNLRSFCNIIDVGCNCSSLSVDYPDYARKAATLIVTKEANLAILICKTGIGMSIAANRLKGVRAALCRSTNDAKAAREHNNANVLCIGADTTSNSTILKIANEFLCAKFCGGRHSRRVDKIEML